MSTRYVTLGGERGIRTPGASQHDGFQDRCNRPLYHLSLVGMVTVTLIFGCKGITIFWIVQMFLPLFADKS